MIPATFLHAGRVFRPWISSPEFWVMAAIAPLIFLYIMIQLFGGLVRQLTGSFNSVNATILVLVAWAFILAITGSSTIFSERQAGLYERFAIMPAPLGSALAGRVVAEFARIILMMTVVGVVSVVAIRDKTYPDHPIVILPVLLLVALAAATLGTLVGFTITSVQGAVAVMPLIVVAMFINTQLMPAEQFRPILWSIADWTPVSVVGQAVNAHTIGDVLPFILWFIGITALCGLGLMRRARTLQH